MSRTNEIRSKTLNGQVLPSLPGQKARRSESSFGLCVKTSILDEFVQVSIEAVTYIPVKPSLFSINGKKRQ
jgi:hypothetical protein